MAGNRAFFPTLHNLREEVGRGKNEISNLCGSKPSAQTLRKWEAGSPGSYTLVSKVFNIISGIYSSEEGTLLEKREHVFRLNEKLVAADGRYAAYPDFGSARQQIGKRPSEVASEIGIPNSEYKLLEGYNSTTCYAAPVDYVERVLVFYRSRIVLNEQKVVFFTHGED